MLVPQRIMYHRYHQFQVYFPPTKSISFLKRIREILSPSLLKHTHKSPTKFLG